MPRVFALVLALLLAFSASAHAGSPFVSICYHDVADADPDQTYMAVGTEKLAQQFNWLRENGYHPVSVDQILAAQNGGPPLPDHAVLLTFDDGYVSFHAHVFPLLRAFNYPAVLAVVGSWIDTPAGQPVHYGETETSRDKFLTWDQLREMARSGLVEVASHSYALHKGVPANPQGNLEPAFVTRVYDAKAGTYESDEAYRARIKADLASNQAAIERAIGKKPRVMVWPYGAYNGTAQAIARDLGMPVTLTLDEGVADSADLSAVPRRLVMNDPSLPFFAQDVRNAPVTEPLRGLRVRLDDIYDPDPERQEANLDRLIDLVKKAGANAVFLQAFADPDGTGVIRSVYFPNRFLPVRADLFNRVAWQIMSRNVVYLYAWMPATGFQFPYQPNPYPAAERRLVAELYEDLARQSPLEGVLFSGMPSDDDGAADLDLFTRQLADRLKIWRRPVKTARLITKAEADAALSGQRDLGDVLDRYDYALWSATTPDGEAAKAWSRRLASAVAHHPQGLRRTVFEVAAGAGTEPGQAVRPKEAKQLMSALVLAGAKNIGLFAADAAATSSNSQLISTIFSLSESYTP